MNKKLLSSGVIIALLSTNMITAYSYNKNIKALESEVKYLNYTNKHQLEVIHKGTKAIIKQEKEIDKLNSIILNKNNSIKTLKQQLEKAKKRNESPSKILSRGKSEKKRVLNVRATAYTSDCYGCSGITYSGENVRNKTTLNGLRIIATDNNVIPLYSIVRVDTKNESFNAIVLDRGGGIKNYELDLLVKTESEAYEFGVQMVQVTVIRKGKGDL